MYEKIKNFIKNHWFVLCCIVAFGVLVVVGLRGLRGHVDIDVNMKRNTLNWEWNRSKRVFVPKIIHYGWFYRM